MCKRIYISGASGAGVTTLGAAVAQRLQLPHFDVDDFYWYPTDPPFELSRPPAERVDLLTRQLEGGQWVLCGSLDGWGDKLISCADLVVFVDTPAALRLERLKTRESRLFGERILPGGDMHAKHMAFLSWAESYEDGTCNGRSRARHERWLKQLPLPWLRVRGEGPAQGVIEQVMAAVAD